MQTTLVSFLLFAGFTGKTLAAVFITNPIASTNAQGGQTFTINWQDDGAPPTLADIGPCEFGLFAGNMQQQTELQPIAPSVDVSKQSSQVFTINASTGPNSGAYFIRVTSLALKDAKNPQFPYQAFSAKFNLSSMSGQFSPSVQAQIDGVTSASSPASTPAAVSPSSALPLTSATISSPSSMTTSKATTGATTATSAVKSGSTSSSAAKPTQSNAALVTRVNMGVLGVAAAVVALIRLL